MILLTVLSLTVLSCTIDAVETRYERDFRVCDACGTGSVPCEDWPSGHSGELKFHLEIKKAPCDCVTDCSTLE